MLNLITLQVSKVKPQEAGVAGGRPSNLVLLPPYPVISLLPFSSGTYDSRDGPGWCHLRSHTWSSRNRFVFLKPVLP